jgi:hypothetical protein
VEHSICHRHITIITASNQLVAPPTMRDSINPPSNPDKESPVETAAIEAKVNKSPANVTRRDPSPAPQRPARSPTHSPTQSSVLHEQRQHSGIVPAGPDDVEDEDEFALNDGYETASTGSTSFTSSIYAHTYENGRRYQHFKNGRYPIPNDDEELNREDMKHAMMMELCDGQLFYAPIGDNPQKILDIGTGTGKSIFNQSIAPSISRMLRH